MKKTMRWWFPAACAIVLSGTDSNYITNFPLVKSGRARPAWGSCERRAQCQAIALERSFRGAPPSQVVHAAIQGVAGRSRGALERPPTRRYDRLGISWVRIVGIGSEVLHLGAAVAGDDFRTACGSLERRQPCRFAPRGHAVNDGLCEEFKEFGLLHRFREACAWRCPFLAKVPIVVVDLAHKYHVYRLVL